MEVPLTHECLEQGFSHVEQDDAGWSWRWTDGYAFLPLNKLSAEEMTLLELTVDDQDLLYWTE